MELKRARKLASMPATAVAVVDGVLSMDQGDLLAHVNQPDVAALFARDESMLIGHVSTLRFRHGERAVKYWLSAAHDEVGHEPSSLRQEERHLSAVRTIWDTVDVAGTLDVAGGTEFLSELDRLERRLFEADWSERRPAATGQRRADALVEMARRSRTMPANGQPPAH